MSIHNRRVVIGQDHMIDKMIPLRWVVGYADSLTELPVEFIPATVPGAVQLDIAKNKNYPDYHLDSNYKMFGWMEDKFYRYQTQFKKPQLDESERLWFVSKGIDYQFEIILNGRALHSQEGMFTHVELDMTDYLVEDNLLEVVLMPVPKRFPEPKDRTQASNVVKPAVSYLWDWHPRLIPLGIWDDTQLVVRNKARVSDVYVNYELNGDFSSANIVLSAEAECIDGVSYQWSLKDSDGVDVLQLSGEMCDRITKHVTFNNPNLWWTHDHGMPYLYTSTFILLNGAGEHIQTVSQRIGFRRVSLIMNEGAWSEPKEFPKTRSVAPAQIELNGRKIFAKGSNWINPEIFPGTITAERYQEQLTLAVQSNFNILRTWGGSIVNKDSFFEICDRIGILIWQEFTLACNDYPDDPHYLSVLKQEATSIIKRLRKHACIGLWCGGNELFNNWSGMTDQSLPLRLLNSLCLEYDPLTPFNPTSPMMGMAHGHYVFRWEGKEVFQMMNEAHYTAYSEFGMAGISPIEVLEKIIPAEDLFPPHAGTAWEEHHAFGAWDGDINTWLSRDLLTDYMGEAQNIEELIEQSNTMQSEGYKAIYEEARRQKPYCSMALNWCFNEPWPAAANNSLVVYPNVVKPALKAVENACRPVCASARINKFVWREGEEFFSDIWLLNDKFENLWVKNVVVSLETDAEKIEILEWTPKHVESNTNLAGPTARYRLPRWNTQRFTLLLEVVGAPEYNSQYTLMYRQIDRTEAKTASMNVTI